MACEVLQTFSPREYGPEYLYVRRGDVVCQAAREAVQGEWAKVEHAGRAGWVPTSFLRPLPLFVTRARVRAGYEGNDCHDVALCVCVCGKSNLSSMAHALFEWFSWDMGDMQWDGEGFQDERWKRQLQSAGSGTLLQLDWDRLWFNIGSFKLRSGSCVRAVGVGYNRKDFGRALRLAIALTFAVEAYAPGVERWRPPPGFEIALAEARAALAASRE